MTAPNRHSRFGAKSFRIELARAPPARRRDLAAIPAILQKLLGWRGHLEKSSIFAGEETEKVYDTDCTYSSQWRGRLPFYSCREDGVELPNQWESCREVHRLLSDRYQYFRWRDSGRSECCQIRPRLREREWKLNFSDLRAYPLIILANVFY